MSLADMYVEKLRRSMTSLEQAQGASARNMARQAKAAALGFASVCIFYGSVAVAGYAWEGVLIPTWPLALLLGLAAHATTGYILLNRIADLHDALAMKYMLADPEDYF